MLKKVYMNQRRLIWKGKEQLYSEVSKGQKGQQRLQGHQGLQRQQGRQ